MNLEDFEVGDPVFVEAAPDDIFHSFQGTVKEINAEYLVVEDQDGDCWSVDPIQVMKD